MFSSFYPALLIDAHSHLVSSFPCLPPSHPFRQLSKRSSLEICALTDLFLFRCVDCVRCRSICSIWYRESMLEGSPIRNSWIPFDNPFVFWCCFLCPSNVADLSFAEHTSFDWFGCNMCGWSTNDQRLNMIKNVESSHFSFQYWKLIFPDYQTPTGSP